MFSATSEPKFLATGPVHDSEASSLSQTRPFAPASIAIAVRPSRSFLENFSAAPETRIPRILPPESTALLKTRKSLSFACAVRSTISRPNRMSGASCPNRSMHSFQVYCGNGRGISKSRMSFAVLTTRLSITLVTSCASTNDISTSSCVNSGCRSARKSSSRKHFATCT